MVGSLRWKRLMETIGFSLCGTRIHGNNANEKGDLG